MRDQRRGADGRRRPLRVAVLAAILCLLSASTTRAERTFRIGGPERVYAWAAAPSKDGGVFVAGSFAGTVDFDPSPEVVDRYAAGTKEDPRRRMDAFLAKRKARKERRGG